MSIAALALAVLLIGRAGQLPAQEAPGTITGTVRQAESAEPLVVEELEPERAHNFEVGVKLGLMERRLTLSSALFHMKRRDLVQTVRQDNRSVQVNAGALDVTGFEIEARASLDPLIDGLSVHGSYAYSDPVWKEYVLDGVDFAHRTPVNVSPHVASAGIDWSAASGALAMGAWADHVGAWYMDRANTVESDGFTIFNTRVTAAPVLQQRPLRQHSTVERFRRGSLHAQ